MLSSHEWRYIFGATDGNRTRLGRIDNPLPSQRTTVAYNVRLCELICILRLFVFSCPGSYDCSVTLWLASYTGIDPVPTPWKGVDLASNLVGYKINRMHFVFTKRKVFNFAVSILNLVPRTGIEPVMTGYQPIVIPFNYPGIFGTSGGNRTLSRTLIWR